MLAESGIIPGGSRGVRRWRPNRAARDRSASLVIDVVSGARGISRRQILGRRKSMRIVTSRQLAMYLVHTMLGRTYLETAHVFGRDRTTVSHACARIEDMRDDRGPFEREVQRIEDAISRALDGQAYHAAR